MTFPTDAVSSPLGMVGAARARAGGLLVFLAMVAPLRRRPVRTLLGLLGGGLLLALGLPCGALARAVQEGYRALTHEQLAAHVSLRPLGPQRFAAVFCFPDGIAATFDPAGDEIHVDAHILKWRPWANVLGPRTVHALAPDRALDLFALRRHSGRLALPVDAEHGSATFVAANAPKELELRVTTSGLMMREKPAR